MSKLIKETWFFISSRIFLKNFGTMATIIILFWFTTFYWMGCYTHHGEKITVPDLTGMTVAQVEQTLKGPNLDYKVIDSIFRNDKPHGAIIEQTPTAQSKVKESRTIYLTINATMAPEIALPRVWGKDFDYSVAQLQSCCGIKIGTIKKEVDPKAPNTILEVFYNGKKLIDPGDKGKPIKIPKFSTLEFTVAEGSSTLVAVPRLQCSTVDQAKFTIDGSQLNIGSIIADPSVTDTASAYVWKQQPKYSEGGMMNMGEQVTIWISQDPQGCPEDLDFINEGEEIPPPPAPPEGEGDGGEEEDEELDEFDYGG